jgi:hypothetical protein
LLAILHFAAELANTAAYGATYIADSTGAEQDHDYRQDDDELRWAQALKDKERHIIASFLSRVKRTIHGYRRNNRSGGRSFYQEHYRQKEKGHTERWESYLPDASHEEEDRRRDRDGHTRYGDYAGNDHKRGNRL